METLTRNGQIGNTPIRIRLTGNDPTQCAAIVGVVRPRLSLSSPAGPAKMIMATGSRYVGPMPITTSTTDVSVRLGSRKPCGDVHADAQADFGTGAIVTSLGDRPSSPPV